MEGEAKTVLVSGGSGYLGGWCIVELLRRGYRVRTTVRDLAREPEVRGAVGAEVDLGDRLAFFAADLTADAGWAEAIAGCDYVLHVASPFPPAQPKDPDELIVPAREGTLRVLRLALGGGVERVVVTSSVAAVRGGARPADSPLDEGHWTDLANPNLSPYVRSKTVAEQAAWDLVAEAGARQRLATVNPGAILGPPLHPDHSFSLQMVARLLGGVPGTPRIGFSTVDVRDVADLHIRAMTAPEAGGERFIAVHEFLWMAEVAAILRDGLGPDAAKVLKRGIPDFLVRLMGVFDPSVRSVVNQLGEKVTYSSARAEARLGWEPRPARETVLDTGRAMVAQSSA